MYKFSLMNSNILMVKKNFEKLYKKILKNYIKNFEKLYKKFRKIILKNFLKFV